MRCHARQLLFALVVMLGVGHIIAACGQKGPLYLPGSPDDTPADIEPQD